MRQGQQKGKNRPGMEGQGQCNKRSEQRKRRSREGMCNCALCSLQCFQCAKINIVLCNSTPDGSYRICSTWNVLIRAKNLTQELFEKR